MGTTITKRVAASADDVYSQISDSSINNGDWSGVVMGDFNGRGCGGLFRFTGITVPAGVTIDAAKVTLTAYQASSSDVYLRIWGEQSNAAATFSSWSDYITRAKTTAFADWTPTAWNSGTTYDSADIKAIIQELVNDYGGLAAANIAIFMLNNSSAWASRRDVKAYQDFPADAALLSITYTESTGWANIAKTQGITATDLAKFKGIAVADIAKVNGVAVINA